VAAVAALAIGWLAARRAPRPRPQAACPHVVGLARIGRVAGWLAVAGVVLAVGQAAWQLGAGFPDAHDVWMLRGKVLFTEGRFAGAYFGEWRQAHDNRAYPPLVSLGVAWMHEVARQPDDHAAKLLFVAWYAALVVLAVALLRVRLGGGLALAAGLGLSACATGVMSTIWGTADTPLAFAVLAAGAVLLVVDDERALRRLLALPLLAAVLTKNEGQPVALAVALATLAVPSGGGTGAGVRARVVRAAAVLAPAGAALAAWWALALSLGLPLVFTLPGADAGLDWSARAGLVLGDAGRRLLDPSWLPGWLAFAFAAAWVAWSSRPSARAGAGVRRHAGVAALVVMLVSAYFVVLAGYRGDLPYLLANSSARLLWHAYPLALVTAFWACPPPPALSPPSPGSPAPAAPRAVARRAAP